MGAGEQAWSQANLAVTAKAAHTRVIPKPLWTARLSEEDVGSDQGTPEVVVVPLAPQQVQPAKVLLIPGASFQQDELLICLPVNDISFTNLIHESSPRLTGTSPFSVTGRSDLQF